MAAKSSPLSFEQRLEQLEQLVEQMEAGGLPLEQLMKAYEEGMKLVDALGLELQGAQERLLKLRGTQLEPVDEAPGV